MRNEDLVHNVDQADVDLALNVPVTEAPAGSPTSANVPVGGQSDAAIPDHTVQGMYQQMAAAAPARAQRMHQCNPTRPAGRT